MEKFSIIVLKNKRSLFNYKRNMSNAEKLKDESMIAILT